MQAALGFLNADGLYYLTCADEDNEKVENQLPVRNKQSPLGPLKHQGVFLGQTGYCDINHGSVVEYKRQMWYIFYATIVTLHTGHGNQPIRAVVYVHFNEDGTIRLVEQAKRPV